MLASATAPTNQSFFVMEIGLSIVSLLVSFAAAGISYTALTSPERGALYQQRVNLFAELLDSLSALAHHTEIAAMLRDDMTQSCIDAGIHPDAIFGRRDIHWEHLKGVVEKSTLDTYVMHVEAAQHAMTGMRSALTKARVSFAEATFETALIAQSKVFQLRNYCLGVPDGDGEALVEEAWKSIRTFADEARKSLDFDPLSRQSKKLTDQLRSESTYLGYHP